MTAGGGVVEACAAVDEAQAKYDKGLAAFKAYAAVKGVSRLDVAMAGSVVARLQTNLEQATARRASALAALEGNGHG